MDNKKFIIQTFYKNIELYLNHYEEFPLFTDDIKDSLDIPSKEKAKKIVKEIKKIKTYKGVNFKIREC